MSSGRSILAWREKIPAGVIVNRDGIGDEGVTDYCHKSGLPILMRIPLAREIGEAIARGEALVEAFPEYVPRFRELYASIQELAGAAARETISGRQAVGAEGGDGQ